MQVYYEVNNKRKDDKPIQDVKFYYMASYGMKLLKSISMYYNISLVDLTAKFGGEQMLRCQGCSKRGVGQCENPVVYGQYFCQHHLKHHTFFDGLNNMIKRTDGKL